MGTVQEVPRPEDLAWNLPPEMATSEQGGVQEMVDQFIRWLRKEA